MATLISTGNSDGETGRCDAKCHDATGPVCKCCCRGANHGVGQEQAQTNTTALAQELIENLTTDEVPVFHDVQNKLFSN